MPHQARDGFLYGLTAYVWWGLVPLYFAWLGSYPPYDFVAHRILWSALFLGLILTCTRRWPETLRCLTTPKLIRPLGASAFLVAANWLGYVLCVENRLIVQASLGFFVLPLVNVALGLLVLRERPRILQTLAIGVALLGVSVLTSAYGEVPWLALALAVSFAFYGLIRKQVPVDGLTGVAVETIVLLPLTSIYLAVAYLYRLEVEEPALFCKLSLSGVVTAVPLLCFGQAARRLPFTTLGFMQYISPSLQFWLAITLFAEPVEDWTGYLIVWTALVVFSIDSYREYRTQPGAKLDETSPRPTGTAESSAAI